MGLKAYIVKVSIRDITTIDVEVRATGRQNARQKALYHLPASYQASAGEVTLIKGKGRYT